MTPADLDRAECELVKVENTLLSALVVLRQKVSTVLIAYYKAQKTIDGLRRENEALRKRIQEDKRLA